MIPDRNRSHFDGSCFFVVMRLLLIIATFFLFGCSSNSQFLVARYAHPNPTPDIFYVCHGYGCVKRSTIHLSQQDWDAIQANFSPKAPSAEIERKQIALATGKIESIVGKLIGTDVDKPGSPIFFYNPTQQDCIDETVNTSTYLTLYDKAGLLKWHRVGEAARRGYITDGQWPHNTAVITEKNSGVHFAVDSWFHANGESPVIILLDLWKSGWSLDDDIS